MALGENLAQVMNPGFINNEQRYKTVVIEDIPFMQTDDGAIVCIPKEDEVFCAAFVGMSGKGKTMLMHRITEFLQAHWKANVAIMNDVSTETIHWRDPMCTTKLNDINELLHQYPKGMPLVYLYQNVSGFELDRKMEKKYPIITTVIPFGEIVEDLGRYLQAVSPGIDMSKAMLYIRNLKDELNGCDTVTQVKEILDEKLPGKDGKDFKAMRLKILTALDALFKEEILDITNPEFAKNTQLRVEGDETFYDPFTAIMKSGNIPSFITANFSHKKYRSDIVAYYTNQLFYNNTKNFPNQKTFLVFDELKDLCPKADEPTSIALGKVAAMGRINNVGLLYATQFYDLVPEEIRGAKLNYMFAFTHHQPNILSEIASSFDLDNSHKKTIKNLATFEVLAMTKNKFVYYRDDERWEDSKPVKGRIFFPLSNHRQAGKK